MKLSENKRLTCLGLTVLLILIPSVSFGLITETSNITTFYVTDYRSKTQLLADYASLLPTSVTIGKTVCLSRFPEVRINNNLLKIEKKERLPNGVWKLQYYSQWHNKSWRHMILEWLDEEKKLSKIRTETPEET